tara:strand:+ start:647 stop:2404 length:1758 start_codon:yes stop_codon:yes gene_type:complete
MIDPNLNNMNIEDIADRNEYDIRNLINFFIRNKKIICLLPVLSLFLGFLYASSIKKTWEGQFRIVIEEEKSSRSLLSLGSSLSRIPGLDKQVPIKTEVSILNSPSVLMPIYKFSTSDKRDVVNTDEFSKWKKNLTITKERNTNVIAVYFRDKNKQKIIPLLEKISNSYQAYSGRRLKRSQELSIKYLKDQIAIFKIKSANSLKKAQEFAIDQEIFLSESFENNLSLEPMVKDSKLRSFQTKKKNGLDSFLLKTNINIEKDRAEASNDIRKINSQLKKIKEINDPDLLQYISLSIPFFMEDDLREKLEKIESNLVELGSIYRDEDPLISISLKKRKNLIELLKKRSINYLNAAKLEAESRLEASIRPKGVLLKYKELIRNAGRDEATLIGLENQSRVLELEKAKTKDPWEIITKPTINSYPVSPSKSKISFVFLSLGLIFSTLFAFYKEKKSDLIFDLDNISEILSLNFVEEFDNNLNSNKSDSFLFLREYVNKQFGEVINLVLPKDVDNKNIEILVKSLKDKNINKELNLISSPEEFKNLGKSNINILVLSRESITYSEINSFKKYMELFDFNLLGLFALNPVNK